MFTFATRIKSSIIKNDICLLKIYFKLGHLVGLTPIDMRSVNNFYTLSVFSWFLFFSIMALFTLLSDYNLYNGSQFIFVSIVKFFHFITNWVCFYDMIKNAKNWKRFFKFISLAENQTRNDISIWCITSRILFLIVSSSVSYFHFIKIFLFSNRCDIPRWCLLILEINFIQILIMTILFTLEVSVFIQKRLDFVIERLIFRVAINDSNYVFDDLWELKKYYLNLKIVTQYFGRIFGKMMFAVLVCSGIEILHLWNWIAIHHRHRILIENLFEMVDMVPYMILLIVSMGK